MTIATRFPKSWAIPRIDIRDPSLVLYLPLWYPSSDMVVASGGTLYSHDKNRISGTTSGAVWTPPRGYVFDGTDDYIDLGQPSAMLITGVDANVWSPLTILAWVNPTNFSTGGLILGQIDGSGYTGCYLFHYQVTSGVLRFFRGNAVDAERNMVGTAGLTASVWSHVVVNCNAARTASTYINAVFDASSGMGAIALADSGDNFRIGYSTYPDNPFEGTIGEVWLYNRALSEGEIAHHYQVTKWRYS